MFCDGLSNCGLFTQFLLCFIAFVLSCFAATSSWNKVELSNCQLGVNPQEIPALRNNIIKLYMQPNTGVCWEANATTTATECYKWTDAPFWSTWWAVTGTGSEAKAAIESSLPRIFSLNIAMIFFCLFPCLLAAFHYFKPDTLSRYVTQLLSGIFTIFVLVWSAMLPAENGKSVINVAKNWQIFYSQLGHVCDGSSSTAYIGSGCSVMVFFLAFGAFVLNWFPTGFNMCFTFVDSRPNGGDEATSTADIKAGLVSGDQSASEYVPPQI